MPKDGGRFDLPIALGILMASGQVPVEAAEKLEVVGELALDGALRPVTGVLPTALAARRHQYQVARLLRERPIEAGLLPNFSEVEEREELFLIRAAWDRFLQSLSAAGDPRLLAIEETGLTAEQFYQFYLDRCQFSDLELKPTHGPRPDLEPAVAQACELVREVESQIPDPLPEGEPDRLMATVRRRS